MMPPFLIANLVELVAPWCLLVMVGAIVLALLRLWFGPTRADRAVAIDVLTIIAAVVLGGWALQEDEPAYLAVALVIALVSFLGTVAVALFVEAAHAHESRVAADDANDR